MSLNSPPLMAPPPAVPVADHTSDDEVEMRAVVRRLSVKNTAPGPDGVPGRVWVLAMEALGSLANAWREASSPLAGRPGNWSSSRSRDAPRTLRPRTGPSCCSTRWANSLKE
ncbi:hypothetical protein PYW07_013670 [Mythimna separata]|uniref:Uncharacterized protein n=1 Tax=Mythimna separata TaxID=271217 RepID=A0AAD8DPM5_MYTSE|nr:hypothetical protein PYW07_013670 [Mythimna separata]